MKIASYNAPHRLRPHRTHFQKLAEIPGVAIICAQESTDTDPGANCPRGWKYYRPKRAQSNVVYWDPKVVTPKRKGTKRLSSPGFRSLRYGVWVHFKTPMGPMRVMSIHLPAFYSSSAKNKREYDQQVRRLVAWARNGRNRIVGGDYNGSVGSKRMSPLEVVMRFSDPVKSGPSGQKIDYVAFAKHGRFKAKKTVLGGKGRSDHEAVIVTVGKV